MAVQSFIQKLTRVDGLVNAQIQPQVTG